MIKAVEVNGLNYRYKGQENDILQKVQFSMNQGEIIGIMGPSGGGKSTLCYAIKGIIPFMMGGNMTGEVNILGKSMTNLTPQERVSLIGMVFQDPHSQLFSSTVEDELAFALENMCVSRAEMIKRIDQALHLLGLEKYRTEHPSNLSGGEQQLVALGSVLVLEPAILILDEAMAQIDHSGRQRLKAILRKLRGKGITIMMVDHQKANLDIADRIMYLANGTLYDKEI